MKQTPSRLVYSTEQGRLCPDCRQPQNQCRCSTIAADQPVGDGKIRIRRETKGRKGKGVTLVEGLALTPADVDKLAREMKTRCGCGGSVKHGVIEIQGDQRQLILGFLAEKNMPAKIAGG